MLYQLPNLIRQCTVEHFVVFLICGREMKVLSDRKVLHFDNHSESSPQISKWAHEQIVLNTPDVPNGQLLNWKFSPVFGYYPLYYSSRFVIHHFRCQIYCLNCDFFFGMMSQWWRLLFVFCLFVFLNLVFAGNHAKSGFIERRKMFAVACRIQFWKPISYRCFCLFELIIPCT